MLRTLPSSSSIHHRTIEPVDVHAPFARRKGGQLGNTNAFKHGFYSSLHASPLTQDFDLLCQLRLLSSSASESIPIDLLERQVQDTFELLIDHFLDTDEHLGPQTTVKLDRFFRTVSVSLRLKRRLKQLRDERDFLPDLARNALALSTLEFTDLRISAFACYGANQAPPQVGAGLAPALPGPFKRQVPCSHRPSPVSGPPFVPHLLQKNPTVEPQDLAALQPGDHSFCPIFPPAISANTADSGPSTVNRQLGEAASSRPRPPWTHERPGLATGTPFVPHLLQKNHTISSRLRSPVSRLFFPLTPSQQAFLAPILVSLRTQLADMAIRQREHAYPDLFLLQAILLRLAFGLRWSDLPPEVPIRPCQLLYKQLCTSGRMQLIYRLLHEDLASNGRKNLLEMVDSGAFQYENGRIYLTADQPVTWESFTGLLLLQRACLNQRRKKRADINERHRNGRYERERSIMREHRVRRTPSPRRTLQRENPAEAAFISVFDCQTTNPILNSKLGFTPGDFPCSSP